MESLVDYPLREMLPGSLCLKESTPPPTHTHCFPCHHVYCFQSTFVLSHNECLLKVLCVLGWASSAGGAAMKYSYSTGLTF